MQSVKTLIRSLRSKSFKYLLFRSKYELERKSGLLRRNFPIHPKMVKLPSLDEWKRSSSRFLFNGRDGLCVPQIPSESLREDTKRILNGNILFFSNKWIALGLTYDWVTNPLTGYHYDVHLHWTKVNDFSKEAGDIKFVWEASRFCWLYTIVRNDYHNGEDHSGFVFARIIDWIDKNPLNCGPNYKCSQETSLRILNWLFALNFYKNSENLTDEIWDKIITSVYWQIHHVYNNINFSRIAVRNNHVIAETLTLYLVGLLFPLFPCAAQWKQKGKRWFEQEIEYQFESDGSYIQNSMNYQRVVTQLLILGISLAHKNEERFDKLVYDRAYANLNFLYQIQDEKTGMLPNYGSNDGALFFQLSSADYCDFRPQLDALNYILTGNELYGKRLEESLWYGITECMNYPIVEKKKGIVQFKNSGYYIVRDSDSTLFVRCGTYKGICKPDQLHIDWWKGGENLLIDSGTYLYNTDERTLRYFGGTEGHNTVMIGCYDQMQKGERFVWTNSSKIISVYTSDSLDEYILKLNIKSFRYLDGGHVIKRTIQKKKCISELIVTDEITPKASVELRQLWHTAAPEKLKFESNGIRTNKERSFSRYYGHRETSIQIEFTTNEKRIETTIKV